MNHISFAPYVGPRYRQSPVRLLLVGESHYGELGPEDDPWEVTRTVVRKWQSREWAIRYLTVAGRILSGKPAWEVDREQVFAQAAFYNFVQFVMPRSGTGRPPTREGAPGPPSARCSNDGIRPMSSRRGRATFGGTCLRPTSGRRPRALPDCICPGGNTLPRPAGRRRR